MSGPISMLGGMEHTPGCEAIDRRLLDAVGVDGPVVTVVPVAAAVHKRPRSADLARRYWARLGADVRVALPDEDGTDCAVKALGEADVLVLPGGDPGRLDSTLRRTGLLDEVLARWEAGVGLTGSSAGAIVLAEWRPRLRPPGPLKLVPGFGVLTGCAVAPHYDKRTVRRWARRVSKRRPDLLILGLGERSGIVGIDGHFRVAGPVPCTLLRDGEEREFQDGDEMDLTAVFA